jgi:hypothetical protein
VNQYLNAFGSVSGSIRLGEFILRPLALGHLVILEGIDHPIIRDGEWDAADIVSAFAIGSGDSREDCGYRLLSDEWKPARDALAADLARYPEKVIAARAALVKWWNTYFQIPPILPGPGGPTPQTPWTARAAVRAMRAGLTYREAWWGPIGEALWLGLAAAELDGCKITLRTEELDTELKKLGW